MRNLTLALAISAIAAPAFAGPVGSGLWHTEAVHKARQTAVTISHADASCLAGVAPSVAQHSAVRAAAVKNGKLAVEFHSQDARTSNASAVHALVAKACAGAQLANA
ncbi:MAG: hypothetical protein J0I28_04985 [Caulobacterales bacterium]|mgnify:CR=1 FL=1|nr:hypothetical protein [Caulobacterales bacterium]